MLNFIESSLLLLDEKKNLSPAILFLTDIFDRKERREKLYERFKYTEKKYGRKKGSDKSKTEELKLLRS